MILKTLFKAYKKLISPLIHYFFNGGCRFYPTCSDYVQQSIKKYGLLKGCLKGAKRIIRCNPFNKGGYDPC